MVAAFRGVLVAVLVLGLGEWRLVLALGWAFVLVLG